LSRTIPQTALVHILTLAKVKSFDLELFQSYEP